MATLQSLAILLSMREISHTLSSYPACAHPHLAIARLGRLEDALLDESLLAERFVGEVLPFALLVLALLKSGEKNLWWKDWKSKKPNLSIV